MLYYFLIHNNNKIKIVLKDIEPSRKNVVTKTLYRWFDTCYKLL